MDCDQGGEGIAEVTGYDVCDGQCCHSCTGHCQKVPDKILRVIVSGLVVHTAYN